MSTSNFIFCSFSSLSLSAACQSAQSASLSASSSRNESTGPVALAGNIGGKGSSSRSGKWGMDFSFGQPRPAQQKFLLGRRGSQQWKQQMNVKFVQYTQNDINTNVMVHDAM